MRNFKIKLFRSQGERSPTYVFEVPVAVFEWANGQTGRFRGASLRLLLCPSPQASVGLWDEFIGVGEKWVEANPCAEAPHFLFSHIE